jgi:FKBP-type peptidyl-prolyl cis-trans isomerase
MSRSVACLVLLLVSHVGALQFQSTSQLTSKGAVGVDRRGALKQASLGLMGVAAFAKPSQAAVKISPDSVRTTKNGIKFATVKEGACPVSDFTGKLGTCYPADQKYVVIDYTAFLPTGEVFDSTEKKGGKPLAFRMGSKQTIPGVEEVIKYMTTGEEVQALIPAAMAYGDKGVCTENGECLVPPGSNLKYYIKLIKVTPAAG